MAFVRDAEEGMVRFYLDNRLLYEKDAPLGVNPFDQDGPLWLGAGTASAGRFKGLLDEIQFSRYAKRDFRNPTDRDTAENALALYKPAQAQTEAPDKTVSASWDEIDRLGLPIVPCPKNFTASGEPLPLDGSWQVSLVTPGAEAGLSEISNRFAVAGVVWEGDHAQRLPSGRIVIGNYPDMAAHLERIGNPPCPPRQGYTIGFYMEDERPVCVVAGADINGTRYGCVTLAGMAKSGEPPVLIQANVSDWPDYKYRMNFGLYGTNPAELKPLIDQIFRAKINLTWGYGFFETLEGMLSTAAERKEIYRYAAERGIRVVIGGHWDVGSAPYRAEDFKGYSQYFYPYKPEEGLIGMLGRAYSWSRDDLIAAKAQLIQRFMAETGADIFYLHCMDTGGRDNSENWNSRTAMDRERWGDDRAAADANVLLPLYAAAKQQNPDALIFPVIYPYGASYLKYPDVRAWLERLSSLVPEDLFFCVREAPREAMQQWKDATRQGRFVYHEPYRYSYGLMFDSAGRYARTFFFDDRDVYWFCSSSTDNPARWVAAEYAWNTQAPGWGWMPADFATIPQADSSPAEVTERLLPRITANLFGTSAADNLAKVYEQSLPIRLVSNLQVFLGADPEAYFKTKYEAALKAVDYARAGAQQVDPPYQAEVNSVQNTVTAMSHLIEARYRYFVCRRLLAEERLDDATYEATLAHASLKQIATNSAFYKSYVPVLLSDLNLAASVQWRRERKRYLASLPPTTFSVGLYSLGYYKGWESGLVGVPGVQAGLFSDPTQQELKAFDVIVFPAARDMGDTSEDWRENVRQFVERGGSVIFSHNSVGRLPSSAFGNSLFPDICAGYDNQIAKEPILTVSAAHPALDPLNAGDTFTQEYHDHLSIRPGPEGKVLLRDSMGNPVLVVGTYGKGRVIYTGQIFGMSRRDEQREPEDQEWTLLYHLLRWCAHADKKS